jgi:hypothetical protein
MMAVSALVILLAAGYLLFESGQTARLLSDTRALILDAINDGVKGLPAKPTDHSNR